ncbi:putative ABC transport system permease protein [Nocardioides zeae]|uniref:ABC transport system permease protein n=1 Tax=Nocardioides zeae TaxID=1457234 RepID=A0ACC6IM77_9ACTN|nr:FtsX-like permease family protein [Nocardioides zeae]MDR6173860.1 putative ABC transport system permease protein [Nocardioides zeae]MDR6211851.1 putative ABC transport system permease protein [Nocardioides zeae]
MTGWRPLLRLARRDLARHRGRTAIVLVMLTLPVLVVTAGAVLFATGDISSTERLDRELGPEGQAVLAPTSMGPLRQAADPDDGWSSGTYGESGDTFSRVDEGAADPAAWADVLGDRPVLEVRGGSVEVEAGDGRLNATGLEVDLTTPLGAGLVEPGEGRLPAATDEVAVSAALARRGAAIGDEIEVGGAARTVVGIAESRTDQGPFVTGPIGALGLEVTTGASSRYLVGGDPVTWADVEELNAEGVLVLSRAVVDDPPAEAGAVEAELAYDVVDDGVVATGALIVVMVLLEVVLLAGPAFAVGARRQARTVALLVTGGATPGQVRGLVLASGVVLGVAAAVVGVLGGIAVAALVPWGLEQAAAQWPWVDRQVSGGRLGPFDVPWGAVLAVASFGVVSAVLAAVVPAWLASRTDVVAVLAGRRGDDRPGHRSPVVGAVLVALGVVAAVAGALDREERLVAFAAVPLVIGTVLLVAPLLALLGRSASRLPLALRFAVRDSARHRSRTVPAIAAVAATVAGAVALGIGGASDAAQEAQAYSPELPLGQAVVRSVTGVPLGDDLAAAEDLVPPGAVPVTGLGSRSDDEVQIDWSATILGDGEGWSYGSWTTPYGSQVLVTDDLGAADLDAGIAPADRDVARHALAAGRALVVVMDPAGAGEERQVQLTATRWPLQQTIDDDESDELVGAEVPATLVRAEWPTARFAAVLPTALAAEVTAGAPAEVQPATTALLLPDGPGPGGVRELQEQLEEELPGLTVYEETGYESPPETVWVLVGLATVALLLVLVGSLTATTLAINDAARDLATLGAVGATPGVRRRIAASYALVITGVGAGLGLLVGLVPGIAVTFPLTAPVDYYGYGTAGLPGPVLAVPWLLIGALVLLLPAVVAAIAAATTRSATVLVGRGAAMG